MDHTIPFGAPSRPLQITIGTTAYTLILHENGDGTYVLRLQAPDGEFTDLAATLAEINLTAGETGDIYTLPAGGIPAADMAVAYLHGKVTLNGVNPTPVVLDADTPAQITGTEEGPFALSDGDTLIVNPDGDGDDTVTFAATAGKSVSDTGMSTDMSLSTDTKLKVAYNGAAPVEVTFDWTSCDSGAAIATQMQTAIRAALEGNPAVTVSFGDGKYTITSPTAGTGSGIVITDADANNCADDLKLGTANGGTETAGTGDAADIAAATAGEVAAAINTKATGWTAVVVGKKVRIVSATDGKDSSLVVNSSCTADTILGIENAAYGAQGLGHAVTMKNTDYAVLLTLNGTAKVDIHPLSVTDRSKSGFNITSTTDGDTDDVDVLVVGETT